MNKRFSRHSFFKRSAILGAGAALSSLLPKWARPDTPQDPEKPDKPKTNIEDALEHPRTETSMPGKFPAKVVKVTNPGEGVQKEESPNGRKYMKMAEKLGLGTEELEKIDLKEINLV